ncbi:MAG: ATP-dependent Clp protease adaptor ClpS [Chloroflexi bacterium]|nr:MAG: ATP-dependent Clp protease adaptor ClpS [Chloroflexota bacterium]
MIHNLTGDSPDIQEEIEQEQEEALEPLYRVFVHNDDITPYDFVVIILQRIFNLTPPEAEHVTFIAHVTGIAYVTTLPLKEAQEKVGKAQFAASLEGYPLSFSIEPE